MKYEAWEGFKSAKWSEDGEVNVRDFIQHNYTPYEGGSEFLAPPTKATLKLWDEILKLSEEERKAGGVLDADTKTVSTLTSRVILIKSLKRLSVYRRTSLLSVRFNLSAE